MKHVLVGGLFRVGGFLWVLALGAPATEFSVAQGITLRTELPSYPDAPLHPLFSAYRDFFELSPLPVRAGGVTFGPNQTLFVQTYKGEGAGRWVLLVHGFLESSSLNARAIDAFLRLGYSVAALDLPGHGLSSGERGVVDDFDRYGEALQRVVSLVEAEATVTEWTPVGFSAGGASVMNWFLRFQPDRVSRLVFVAPLVHSWLWDLSQVGLGLFGWALDRVPNRSPRDSTSNPVYATMLAERDPFRSSTTSLTWVRALTAWAARVPQFPAQPNVRVLLLQGGQDSVVDSDFNRAAILRLFPKTTTERFPSLRHTLLNEPGHEGERVYATIEEFLAPPISTPARKSR